MHSSIRLIAFAAAAFVSLAADGAHAATTADTAARPGAGASGTASRSGNDRVSQTGTVEQRIVALRAKLQITTAQEPQWNQFAQVMRDNAQRMDDTFQRRVQGISTQNAEENMTSYAQVAAAHAQGMQNLVPAFHAVYVTMTDLQKKAADQVFRDDAYRDNGPRSRQGAAR
jgi:periplasmic protein CpxP/Spy